MLKRFKVDELLIATAMINTFVDRGAICQVLEITSSNRLPLDHPECRQSVTIRCLANDIWVTNCCADLFESYEDDLVEPRAITI